MMQGFGNMLKSMGIDVDKISKEAMSKIGDGIAAIQDEFSKVHNRLNEVEARFDSIERILAKIDNEFLSRPFLNENGLVETDGEGASPDPSVDISKTLYVDYPDAMKEGGPVETQGTIENVAAVESNEAMAEALIAASKANAAEPSE